MYMQYQSNVYTKFKDLRLKTNLGPNAPNTNLKSESSHYTEMGVEILYRISGQQVLSQVMSLNSSSKRKLKKEISGFYS